MRRPLFDLTDRTLDRRDDPAGVRSVPILKRFRERRRHERRANAYQRAVELVEADIRQPRDDLGADMPLSAALPYEQSMIGLVFDTSDAHEGCSAFLEKRNASFAGR